MTDIFDGKTAFKAVLDHGSIELIDSMPRVIPSEQNSLDYAVVEAARVSTGKGLADKIRDENLLDYLYRNHHTSPFEMIEFKWRVKAPLFVFNQWVRHRTANINCQSARYMQFEKSFYVPDKARTQSKSNKQVSEPSFENQLTDFLKRRIPAITSDLFEQYEKMIDLGIARELARLILPQNTYTNFIWKNDLKNTLDFLRLRLSNHAQWEIRQYAEAIKSVLQQFCPQTIRLFNQYTLDSITLSKSEQDFVKPLNTIDYATGTGAYSAYEYINPKRDKELKRKLMKIL